LANTETTPPAIGTLVYCADGAELGRVEEVSPECFKLDIQFGPDWWLGADTVANQENGTAILRLTRAAIRDLTARQAGAGHVGFHLHH
jgi:hypothetical protein